MSKLSVYKYELQLQDERVIQKILMPGHAKVIHVASQHGHICLWAEVQTDMAPVHRNFIVIPTGGEVPENAAYLGTIATPDYYLVWHVYEVL